MNSTLFAKRRSLLRSAILLVLTLGAATVFSQNPFSRGNNNNPTRRAGFSQIFYSTQTFDRVLQGSDRVRLFSGINDDRRVLLMAIGLDANGNEIGNDFIGANDLNIPSQVTRAQKDQFVANIVARNRLDPLTAEFEAADLQNLLNNEGVTGLIFTPSTNTAADGTQVLSLTVAAATSSTNRSTRFSPIPSPCPPDCGSQ